MWTQRIRARIRLGHLRQPLGASRFLRKLARLRMCISHESFIVELWIISRTFRRPFFRASLGAAERESLASGVPPVV